MPSHNRLASIGLLLSCVACSADTLPVTAADTVTFTARHLARHDTGVFWDLLPAGYRRDLDRGRLQIAAQLPAETYDKFFRVVYKLGVILKTKAEYLANYGLLQMAMKAIAQADEEDLIAFFVATGEVCILLAKSEVATREKLQQVDLGRFLGDTVSELWVRASRASRVTGKQAETSLAALRCSPLSTAADRSRVRITFDREVFEMEFRLVEGRWVPSDLAEAWPDFLAGMEALASELQQPATRLALAAADEQLDELIAVLDKLQATQSRSRFHAILEQSVVKYRAKVFDLVGGAKKKRKAKKR